MAGTGALAEATSDIAPYSMLAGAYLLSLIFRWRGHRACPAEPAPNP